ncbi:MAG: cytochrome c peroxidase [Pseudomonadota bacterium]
MNRFLCHLVVLLCLALPVQALDLPAPLSDADFLPVDPDKAKIGQLLFYDKILSGNRNISCGTCHHHDHAGTDGLSLGIGEGGVGVGPERTAGTGAEAIRKRIPRNAPALWNLGHRDITVMFHDGRLSKSDLFGNGFNSPAEEWLPQGLETILAAQALFPLTAQFEMAGNPRENEVTGAVHDRIDLGWPILAKRVRTIPEYGRMFVETFDHIEEPAEVTIVEIANAIGAFIAQEWRNHDSPFDAYLGGDTDALSAEAKAGMQLFYGDVGCAGCHAGPLLSDQGFRALGLPAFGPGRTRPFDPYARDVGRMGESNQLEDAYRFRTPMLRNVALTGPYGHNGAYPTLEAMVRHHLDPAGARAAWMPEMANLPAVPWLETVDFVIRQDSREMARQAAVLDIDLPRVSDAEVAQLVAFLEALTGETAETRPLGRPETVPSGLSVD